MKNDLCPAFAAVLFAAGEPVSIDRFAEVFEIDFDEVTDVMKEVEIYFENSGIELLKLENTYQLCSDSKYADYIRKMADIRRKTPLSNAAMEVLSVVAYNQPVTRAFVEQVRGVDCSSTVATLVEKGLLEERGRLELPGRPLLYGTTKNFLRCFGISDISELPQISRTEDNLESPELGEQLSVEAVLQTEDPLKISE